MVLWFELFLIGVGLSMDAFAVSVCKGLGMTKLNRKQAVTIGIYFGGFQALMPLVGYFLGVQFANYIENFDHWIAFILLVIIGGKMVIEALTEKEEETEVEKDKKLSHKEMLLLAIATSIDALAVGVSVALAYTKNSYFSIWGAVGLIGVTTFALSVFGVWVGNIFGSKYKKRAEVTGGIILILIGSKVLFEHLGLLPF